MLSTIGIAVISFTPLIVCICMVVSYKYPCSDYLKFVHGGNVWLRTDNFDYSDDEIVVQIQGEDYGTM